MLNAVAKLWHAVALSLDMGAYSSWPLSPSIARIENLQEP